MAKEIPFGVSRQGEKTLFSVFSENAQKIELCLFSDDEKEEKRIPLTRNENGVWTVALDNVNARIFGYVLNGKELSDSAGYYAYLWAEVLDADAFQAFEEKGVFDKETAKLFRDNILSKGNSDDPMTLYRKFRGADPDPKYLLKNRGFID